MVVFVKVKAKTNPSAPTLRQWRWMMETVNSAIEFAIVDGGGVVWPLQRRKHINSSRVTQMERCTERSCCRILLKHDAHTSLHDAVPFPLCISPLHCTTRSLTYWSWSRKRGRMQLVSHCTTQPLTPISLYWQDPQCQGSLMSFWFCFFFFWYRRVLCL